MKIVAVTQARTNSSRLPRKVIKEIGGKSILEIHLQRMNNAKSIDKIIVATTDKPEDDKIAKIAEKLNIEYFRGDENDVLDRYFQAVKGEKADYIVRITSDCPLIDGEIIDETVKFAVENKLDYCSNRMEYNYPDGIVVEVFTYAALEKAWNEAELKSEREHVAPFIWKNSTFYGGDIFKSANYCNIEKNYAGVRLTIDEAADFELLKILIEKFGAEKNWEFYADEVLRDLSLKNINGFIDKNEGYEKSLAEDKIISKRKKFSTLSEGIKNSFHEYAGFPCVEIGEEIVSYGEMKNACANLSNCIFETINAEEKFIGVFAYRSKTAYIGIYGTLVSGKAYLPLNPKFPAERLKKIIEISKLKTLVLSDECIESFRRIAAEIKSQSVICFLKDEDIEILRNDFPKHQYISINDYQHFEKFPESQITPKDYAYLLFTSGSTGVPKGVGITHENVCSYANYSIEHYDVTTADKLSQMPDITFDLSVHDLFVSVLSGACLAVVPEKELIAPAKFIKEKEITFWTSVPSVIVFLERFKMLDVNAFPSVKKTLFCGEALPARSAELWQKAASNALVENTYGPTETTVAITNYRWDSETSAAESRNGIVPLGKIFPSQKLRLVDEENQIVNKGELGEIVLGGSQVAPGYFNDAEKTAEKFVRFDDEPETLWYKTGDLAQIDENGVLYYAGRIDEQVKIRGYRVELQEIDKVLREAAGTELAVSAVKKSENAVSIMAFVQSEENAELKKNIFALCRKILPEYMVPSEVKFIDQMPFNQNGKIDRKKLIGNFI